MFGAFVLKGRRPFLIFLLTYVLFCLVTFRQYDGICADELDCYSGGAIWLKYYKEHNLEALKPDYAAHNYFFTAALVKLSFSRNLDLDRLCLLNLLFASAIFWLMYELLYFSFQDGFLALIGPLALFLTPRFFGDVANNPKDIPFAVFYFLSLSAMLLKDKFFPGRFFRILGLGIVFGFTIANRIVALSLFPIYGLFRIYEAGVIEKEWAKGQFWKWFIKEFLEFAVIFVVSQVVLCALWPYIGVDYFHHFPEALINSKKFNWDGLILFEGKLINPNFFSWNYLLGWMTVITPVTFLFYFNYSIFRWKSNWKKPVYFLMVLVFGLNLILYYGLKPIIYNGIRHYLFLTPVLVFIACFGVIDFFYYFKKKSVRWVAAVIIGVNLILVVFHMVQLFPYDYLYFNELVGGIQGANGKYEMDYWSKSLKEATLWLKENEIKDSKRSYKIKMTSGTWLATNYFSDNMHGFKEIKDENADFCIIVNSLTGYTIPSSQKIIHVVEREGVPLTLITQTRR